MNQEALPTRGERTRAHIIACAASLFWARSFHGVSVDRVAEAAEVNKATVYRYFGQVRKFLAQFNVDAVSNQEVPK